jgi:CBS domain-containing protein
MDIMHRNTKHEKQGDKLLKMPGKLDRGPVDFKSRPTEKQGEVMAIATSTVISVPQTMSIIGAVEEMTQHGFRRLPVTDPGTHKILGIVTAGDIIDFMGGGTKFNLVQVKHKGNLLAAINETIREIMTREPITLPAGASIAETVDVILTRHIGGIPIVDDQGILMGIVTERDVLSVLVRERSTLSVEDVMTSSLHVTSPDTPIGAATKDMVEHGIRRLPVVSGDVLFGIITATDIMKYLGAGKVFDKIVTGDVSDIMALPVRNLINGTLHTTPPHKNINETARDMLAKNVGALPVIEDSRLVGLVTEYDLVKAFAERGEK